MNMQHCVCMWLANRCSIPSVQLVVFCSSCGSTFTLTVALLWSMKSWSLAPSAWSVLLTLLCPTSALRELPASPSTRTGLASPPVPGAPEQSVWLISGVSAAMRAEWAVVEFMTGGQNLAFSVALSSMVFLGFSAAKMNLNGSNQIQIKSQKQTK